MIMGVLLIITAFILDMALGGRLTIRGVRPDITLAALVPLALAVRAGPAAGFGLLAGVLEGSFVSLAFGSYAVSRTLAGWVVGLLEERLCRDNIVVTMLAGIFGSIIEDTAFFIFAPQPDPGFYIQAALARAAYAACLVVPFAWVVGRLVPPEIPQAHFD